MKGSLTRSAILRQLERLQHGELTVVADDQTWVFGKPSAELSATLIVVSSRMWSRVAFGGSLGAAESYIRGEWMTDNLPNVLRIFAKNLDVADHLEKGFSGLTRKMAALLHWMRGNSRSGSRRNIRDHYDLGDEFFSLFLDDTMTYSSGIFDREDMTMREASIEKLDRVCRKLELSPSKQVIEIGSGWGSFALHAAERYGCRVTTTTISENQYELSRKRVESADLCDHVTVLKADYRDLVGQFDCLVSIEMIEAVGYKYLDEFFSTCDRLLKPDGAALLQAIVMPDHRYASYLRSADFIQRYVFPGSSLPSIGGIVSSLGRTTTLRLTHLEDLAPHYARTLHCWREQFLSRVASVRNIGYDDRFIRLWEFYLAYCAAGFTERSIGVVQLLFEKPAYRSTGSPISRSERTPVGDINLEFT